MPPANLSKGNSKGYPLDRRKILLDERSKTQKKTHNKENNKYLDKSMLKTD